MAIVKEIDDNFFGVVVDTGSNNHVDFKSDRVVSITMAALDTSAPSDEYVQVLIKKSESNKFIMCTLSKQHAVLQQPVQLMLSPGENVVFEVKASKGTVNLTGYYINEDEPFGPEDQDDLKAAKRGGLFLDEEADDDDDDDDEDEDDDDDDELEDDDEDDDDDDDDEDDDEDDEDDDEDEEEDEEESNNKRKQNGANNANKKQKVENDKAPKLVEAKKASEEGKTIQGGVVIRDLREGKGPEAKKGKFIHVYYSGKLKQNGKQFDSCTSGKPFRFRLGQGEVIKGWDVGFEGMKVGGKRQIIVPPGMGYGNKRMGNDIPANSTLVFDVELKAVS